MHPFDRNSKIRRSTRPHSMARCENNYPINYHHHSNRLPDDRNYAMTLPASRGKHRSRRNGIKTF